MKKMLLILSMVLVMSGLVYAQSVIRTDQGNGVIRYSVSGATGAYGVSVEDTITNGDCQPSAVKFVIASDSTVPNSVPNPYDVTFTGTGSCTLSGDYKFGTQSIIGLSGLTFNVGGGGVCSTLGDTSSPCDGQVSNDELLAYITRWVNDEVTNQNLLDVISNWVVS